MYAVHGWFPAEYETDMAPADDRPLGDEGLKVSVGDILIPRSARPIGPNCRMESVIVAAYGINTDWPRPVGLIAGKIPILGYQTPGLKVEVRGGQGLVAWRPGNDGSLAAPRTEQVFFFSRGEV